MKKIIALVLLLVSGVTEARKNCTEAEALKCKCPAKYSCFVFSDGLGCNTPGEPGTGFYTPCSSRLVAGTNAAKLGSVEPEVLVPEACSKLK